MLLFHRDAQGVQRSMRRLFATYLLLQGVCCVAWWAGILLSAAFRDLFKAPGAPDVTLLAFAGADALLFVGGSVVSAVLLLRGAPQRKAWLWLTAGAVTYAALYAIGLSVLSGAAWLGAGAMAAAMVMTVIIAWRAP